MAISRRRAFGLVAGALFLAGCGDDGPSGGGDTTPPGAITDLAAAAATDSSVLLVWTAPGDDGGTGTARSYDVRYSTSPLCDSIWSLSPSFDAPPRPTYAGSSDSCDVTGLAPGTIYSFAVKAADEAPRWSSLSNVVACTTKAAVDAVPPAGVADLHVASATDTSLVLVWTSPVDDGPSGRAASYELRWFPNGATVWDSMRAALDLPVPAEPGHYDSYELKGLVPNAPYGILLRSADGSGNYSSLSNEATGTTALLDPSRDDAVLIPPGTFVMGDGFSYCGMDECEVTLTKAYWFDRYETTAREYAIGLQWAFDRGYLDVISETVRDRMGGNHAPLAEVNNRYVSITFADRRFSVVPGRESYPATYVTWYGAAAYCDWRSLMAGLPPSYDHTSWSCTGVPDGSPGPGGKGSSGYRLPTDAEWEYVTQFGGKRLYPWGDEPPDCDRANYWFYCSFMADPMAPVGSHPAGAAWVWDQPVYDLVGYVNEWCQDYWAGCELGTEPRVDPAGPERGDRRTVRGHSWSSYTADPTAATRLSSHPDSGGSRSGFRAVRPAD